MSNTLKLISILKIIGLLVLVALVVFLAFVWFLMRPMLFFNESQIPRDLITSQFIDFDRVYMISAFRSGAGHDFSSGVIGETCRSMKHYFNTSKFNASGDSQQGPYRSQPKASEPNIKIYAPFDGRIIEIDDSHTGVGVKISPDKHSSFLVRIDHVDLLPEFKFGTHVKSGQWIATIGPRDGVDFSVEATTLNKGNILLSYFEVMTDEVFKPYKDLGFQREDFIISKEYRDAHPFKCGGVQIHPLNKLEETFQHAKTRSQTEDYIYLKADPYPQPGWPEVHIGPPKR